MSGKSYSVGDRYYLSKYQAWGTIISIDGEKGLIDWDISVHSWGENKAPNCWVNLEKNKIIDATSFVKQVLGL